MAKLQVKVRKSLVKTRDVLTRGILALEKHRLAMPSQNPNGASYTLRNPSIRETCLGDYPDHVDLVSFHGNEVVAIRTALERLNNLLESCS